MKDIEYYLKQVDMIDLYVTKNIVKIIKNKKELDFIKSNIFILGFNNKNRKNSLRILLDNREFKIVESLIKHNCGVLDFKNTNKTNLFQMIITIEYFYDMIIDLLENYDSNFLTKIITNKDVNNIDSIDLILSVITSNQQLLENYVNADKDFDLEKSLDKIFKILKSIYKIDNENKILLFNRLCAYIQNEDLLEKIIKYINPSNIDIYPDSNLFTCIDYLFINDNIKVLEYLLPKINYIYFVNSDINFLFEFINRIEDISVQKSISINRLVSLLFDLLSKSNIKKIKNIKNENIMFVLIKKLIQKEINLKDLIDDKYLNFFNLDEQNIFGESISSLLNLKSKTKKNYRDIKIEYKKILEYTGVGIFGSDIEHNMIYTLIMLKKYSNLTIPYFIQDKKYFQSQNQLISLSNNDYNVESFLKNYFYKFNTFLPFIIIWKNLNNYYLDPNLIVCLKNNTDKDYVYIRLSINISNEYGDNIRHANMLFIDNKNKVVERFEPYGEISFYNSQELNLMIEQQIVAILRYRYKFVQSYPGFQLKSDEFEKKNKVYGDPKGFCLAWCLLYLETKLMLLDKNISINPIKYINWYVINQFDEDFPEIKKDSESNKYMTFIRFYAKKLDTRKNELLEKLDIEQNILYRDQVSQHEIKSINKILNKELFDNLNIKQ